MHLLKTSDNFLLGRWIADAKSWAKTENVNLRQQIKGAPY
jgi:Alpha-N-acetylglucosaminidase (NAGLU) C-terminal domain